MENQRIFPPGSEWVYLKVYSGPKSLERFLTNEIASIIPSLLRHKCIDMFFYVRYADPDYHIRFRFHLTDISHFGRVVQKLRELFDPYLRKRIIWKVSFESYNREFERYGMATIGHVESLFFYQSLAAISIIKMTNDDELNDRWMWGCKLVDLTLSEFGLSLNDKISLFRNISKNFLAEFGGNKSIKILLDHKVRMNTAHLEKVLSINDESEIQKILRENMHPCRKDILAILEIKKNGHLEVGFNDLLASIVHMHFNRMFRTHQRAYELVLYYILERYYSSIEARERRKERVII